MRVLLVAASSTLLIGAQGYIFLPASCNLPHRAIEGAFTPTSSSRLLPTATTATSRRSHPLPSSALSSWERSPDTPSPERQQTPGSGLKCRVQTVYTRLHSWMKGLRNDAKISAVLSLLALALVLTTGLSRPALASSVDLNALPDIRQAFRTPLPQLIQEGWTHAVPWCRYKPSPGSFRARVISTLISNFPTWRPLPLVAALATLPYLENKVAIPAGIFMGVPPLKAWAVASASNTAIMPLLALIFRPSKWRKDEVPVPPAVLKPKELKQSITDRLELLLSDLRDPSEYISPKARREARSLVSAYMTLAWSLEDKEVSKLEDKWTTEFRDVDAKKARAWGILSKEDKDFLEKLELAGLEAVKAEVTIEAVALEYAQELEDLKAARDKAMAMDEDLRPRDWKDVANDIKLYDRLGKVVEKLLTAQSVWATLQGRYRAWVDQYADEREAERIQDEEDLLKGRELTEKAAELNALQGTANEKDAEYLKEESRKLQKDLEAFEAHVDRREEESEAAPWNRGDEEWQARLAAGRVEFLESTDAAMREFEKVMKKAERDADIKSKAQVEKEEIKELEKKGRMMLEVGWPRVWGAWTIMYINASNRMKFLPSFLGTTLGVWLAGLAVTGIILTGPLGVLVYSLAILNKLRTSELFTAKTALTPSEPPKSLGDRWRDYWSQAWRDIKADLSAEDTKGKRDTFDD